MRRPAALGKVGAVLVTLLALAPDAAWAEEATIGRITMSFDAAEWRTTRDVAGATLAFEHVEETEEARLRIDVLPRRALSCGIRGMTEMFAADSSVWTRDATVRLRRVGTLSVYVASAQSPCRNWRPGIHRACVDHGGLVHVLRLEGFGCRGGPMQEHVHLFHDLVASIRPAASTGEAP